MGSNLWMCMETGVVGSTLMMLLRLLLRLLRRLLLLLLLLLLLRHAVVVVPVVVAVVVVVVAGAVSYFLLNMGSKLWMCVETGVVGSTHSLLPSVCVTTPALRLPVVILQRGTAISTSCYETLSYTGRRNRGGE